MQCFVRDNTQNPVHQAYVVHLAMMNVVHLNYDEDMDNQEHILDMCHENMNVEVSSQGENYYDSDTDNLLTCAEENRVDMNEAAVERHVCEQLVCSLNDSLLGEVHKNVVLVAVLLLHLEQAVVLVVAVVFPLGMASQAEGNLEQEEAMDDVEGIDHQKKNCEMMEMTDECDNEVDACVNAEAVVVAAAAAVVDDMEQVCGSCTVHEQAE